jgi:uncharacterized protein YecT (DUF1311 family)
MPVFLRKKKAEDTKEMPAPPMPDDEDEQESDDEKDMLTCPKCGMELADSEENRAYVKMRDEESDEDED